MLVVYNTTCKIALFCAWHTPNWWKRKLQEWTIVQLCKKLISLPHNSSTTFVVTSSWRRPNYMVYFEKFNTLS